MVYTMLMEAADAPEPSRFKETDLYKRCLKAGVIPATEEDIQRLNETAKGDREEQPQIEQGQVLTQYYTVAGIAGAGRRGLLVRDLPVIIMGQSFYLEGENYCGFKFTS